MLTDKIKKKIGKKKEESNKKVGSSGSNVDLKKRELIKNSVKVAPFLSLLTTACEEEDPFSLPIEKPHITGAEKWYKGEEKFLKTTCGRCQVNCGIIVRVVEGRAVNVSGNPKSSPNRGVVGPKGLTSAFALYDPDRIKAPLLRKGTRGDGKWEEVSYEDAINIISEKLKEKLNSPSKIAILCGRQKGFTKELFERFAKVIGTPNFYDFSEKSYSPRAIFLAMKESFGIYDLPGFDLENTRYILSAETAIFETTCHGLMFSRSSYKIKFGVPTQRAKILHVDHFYSHTASQADEFIQVRFGKLHIFLCGLAHQLIKEGMYDKEFVKNKTQGFDDFADFVKNFEPEKVEEETGIEAKEIVRIARELWLSRPAVVVVDERSTLYTNGLLIASLSLSLNALLGNINKPGGLFIRKDIPFSPWKEISKYQISGKKIDFSDLPESEVDTIFVYYFNPVYSETENMRWKKFFERADFVVSFSPFMDETSALADIIIPDHTPLERFEDAQSLSSIPYAGFGLRRPVVAPIYKTKNTGDVILDIAKKLGFETDFYFENFKEAVLERLKNFDLEQLEKDGWWEDPEKKPKDFDKFKFTSPKIFEEPKWMSDGEFYLFPYKSIAYAEGSGANIPFLMELSARLKGIPAYLSYETFCEISPSAAEKLGLKNFDNVYISTEKGKIKAKVLIKQGIQDDVILVELGKGHNEFGRFAKGKGSNPRDIIPYVKSQAGNSALYVARVKIEKA